MSSVKSNTSGTEVSELLDAFDEVIKTLGPMRKQIGKLLGNKKRRTAKDPDAEPGESRSAWQEWAKICSKRFAEAYAAHLLEVDKKADVMTFAKKCRDKTHVAEWTAFEAEWSAAHPKPEAKSKKAAEPKAKKATKATKATKAPDGVDSEAEGVLLGSDAESSASKKKAKAKVAEGSDAESSASKKSKKKDPLPSASPAPKAKAKAPAKKGSAKDEKAAAKAALAEASLAAAKADPPTERTYRGRKYMVNSANQVWACEDGEVGDWVGLLAEDGKKLEKTDGPA